MERFVVQPPAPQLDAERDRLLAAVRAVIPDGAEVHEVGSTALPDSIGKGDLDLLIRAPAPHFDATRAALDAVFARNPNQLSNAQYQGYTVDSPLDPELDVALQLTVRDGPYDDFLPFLDALRSDPARLHAYNSLKRCWNGRDMAAYRQAKGDFVTRTLQGSEPLPESCDVAVVGGSLAGVATALYLAREGVDVVLLEAAPFIGHGIAGRGLGPVERGVVEHPHRTIRALGDRIGGLHAFTRRNRELLDAEGLFDPCGVLWIALDDREPGDIPQSLEALTRCGLAAEALDAAEVERRVGAALGPALWLPDEGRIDPFGALNTLLERAVEAGVTVAYDAEATLLDGEPLQIEARGQCLEAEMVVLTAGNGCIELDARLGGGLTPVRDQALLTAPVTLPDAGFTRAGHGWTAWRPHPTGGIVLSGSRWATPHMEVGERDSAAIEDRIQSKLEGFLRGRLGIEAAIVDRWAFTFTNTRDALPVIGPLPGQPRRIACTGFGGNPASFALAAARSVADGILHGEGAVPPMLGSSRLVRWRHG